MKIYRDFNVPFLFLLVSLMLIVSGCSQSTENGAAESESSVDIVAMRIDLPVAAKSDYLSMMQNELDIIRDAEGKSKAILEDVWISSSNGISYLEAKGKDTQGYCANIAIRVDSDFLSKSSQGFLSVVAEEKHTCTGNPCSSCRFVREEGEITGCACIACQGCPPSFPGHCDHTITSS